MTLFYCFQILIAFYGFKRRKTRWVVEGLALFALAAAVTVIIAL